MNKVLTLFTIVLFLGAINGFAKSIKVVTSVDKNKIYIGENINFTVKLKGESLNCMELISPPDEAFSPFIVKKSSDCKITKDGLEKHYLLTTFKLGKVAIPSLKFVYDNKNYITKPVKITIKELLPKNVAKIEPRDIEGMWVVKFPWGKFLLLFIIFVVALLAGISYFRKSKLASEELTARPYWEIAKDKLISLVKKDLIELGYYQPFYYELTEILRYYLQHKYKFPALEMTNTELLQYLKRLPLSDEDKQRIRQLVERSGPIKYANMALASKDICYKDLEFVKNFIQPEEIENKEDV